MLIVPFRYDSSRLAVVHPEQGFQYEYKLSSGWTLLLLFTRGRQKSTLLCEQPHFFPHRAASSGFTILVKNLKKQKNQTGSHAGSILMVWQISWKSTGVSAKGFSTTSLVNTLYQCRKCYMQLNNQVGHFMTNFDHVVFLVIMFQGIFMF